MYSLLIFEDFITLDNGKNTLVVGLSVFTFSKLDLSALSQSSLILKKRKKLPTKPLLTLIRLKVRKSENIFFLKLHCPKRKIVFLKNFCPSL